MNQNRPLKINLAIIPHRKQRYNTCGDYYLNHGTLHIRVSDMGNWTFSMLVFLHEFVEYCLVTQSRIPIKSIDKFDIQFEREREAGRHSAHDEPGNDPRSPYRDQHRIATAYEKAFAKMLGVSWKQYEKAIAKL